MKSKEFALGFKFKLKERIYKLSLEETNDYGWIRVTLYQDSLEIKEGYYIGKTLKDDKIVSKMVKRLNQLEQNYNEIKGKPNSWKVFKQLKRIVANL